MWGRGRVLEKGGKNYQWGKGKKEEKGKTKRNSDLSRGLMGEDLQELSSSCGGKGGRKELFPRLGRRVKHFLLRGGAIGEKIVDEFREEKRKRGGGEPSRRG